MWNWLSHNFLMPCLTKTVPFFGFMQAWRWMWVLRLDFCVKAWPQRHANGFSPVWVRTTRERERPGKEYQACMGSE